MKRQGFVGIYVTLDLNPFRGPFDTVHDAYMFLEFIQTIDMYREIANHFEVIKFT